MKKYWVNWDGIAAEELSALLEAVSRYCNQREKDHEDIEQKTIMAILGIEIVEEDKK